MTLLLNAVVFLHENGHCITFFSKSSVDIQFCMIYQYFLNHRLCNLYWLFHVLFSFYFGNLSHNHFFFVMKSVDTVRFDKLFLLLICFSLFDRVRMYNCFTWLSRFCQPFSRIFIQSGDFKPSWKTSPGEIGEPLLGECSSQSRFGLSSC